MTDAAVDIKKSNNLLENLITKCENSSKSLNALVNTAEKHVKEKVFQNGSLDIKL
jgi:ribosomal silencing factor RsfS